MTTFLLGSFHFNWLTCWIRWLEISINKSIILLALWNFTHVEIMMLVTDITSGLGTEHRRAFYTDLYSIFSVRFIKSLFWTIYKSIHTADLNTLRGLFLFSFFGSMMCMLTLSHRRWHHRGVCSFFGLSPIKFICQCQTLKIAARSWSVCIPIAFNRVRSSNIPNIPFKGNVSIMS